MEKSKYERFFPETSDIITVKELAEILNINVKAGYSLIHKGKIAYLLIGRTVRIPKFCLYVYMEIEQGKEITDFDNFYLSMFRDYLDVVTVKQLSSMLRINDKATYELLHNKYMQYLSIGRDFRIPKLYIFDYIKKNLRKGPLRFDNDFLSDLK